VQARIVVAVVGHRDDRTSRREQRQPIQRRGDRRDLTGCVDAPGPEIAPAFGAAREIDLDLARAVAQGRRGEQAGAEHRRVCVGETDGIVLEGYEGRRQHRGMRLVR